MALSQKEIAEFAFDLQVGLAGADVPEYDAAVDIGMAAVLAVNLRGLGEIDYGALRVVAARLFHIRSDVLDRILRVLADLELIRIITSGHTIAKVIPQVPHFENVCERVGEFTDQKPLNEIEQATLEILNRLMSAPENKDRLKSTLGVEDVAFQTSLEIGTQAGLVTNRRARGRDILASPLYYSSGIDGLIDIAARGEAPNVKRVLELVKKHQGMPLSTIVRDRRIAESELSPDQVEIINALAADGVIRPPAIKRPDGSEEQFVFTPAPGQTRMSAANREIYEKGMALAAAVRKGQLLPEAIRIHSPQALLYRLGERKWIGASTEAAHQYRNLAILGVGRLRQVSGDFYRFHLIDVPENVRAVEIAKSLLQGEAPPDLEQDDQARLLLGKDEQYVKSMLSASSLRGAGRTIVSSDAKREIDQFMLNL